MHFYSDIKIIFVSGFHFSGSSAVTDYLRQSKLVTLIHPLSPETRIFFGKHSLTYLQLSLLRNGRISSEDIKLFLKHILPCKDDFGEKKLNMAISQYYGNAYKAIILKFTELMFDSLYCKITENTKTTNSQIENYKLFCIDAKQFILDFVMLAANYHKSNYVLFDNDPPAMLNIYKFHEYISLLRLVLDIVPDAKVIAVYRDPRDQVTSFLKREMINVKNKFYQDVQTIFRRTEESFASLLYNFSEHDTRNLLITPFERFVLETETRSNLLKFLQIEESSIEDGKFFNTNFSRKSIGRYKDYLKDVDVVSHHTLLKSICCSTEESLENASVQTSISLTANKLWTELERHFTLQNGQTAYFCVGGDANRMIMFGNHTPDEQHIRLVHRFSRLIIPIESVGLEQICKFCIDVDHIDQTDFESGNVVFEISNLKTGNSTDCRLFDGKHILFSFSQNMLENEKRVVIDIAYNSNFCNIRNTPNNYNKTILLKSISFYADDREISKG